MEFLAWPAAALVLGLVALFSLRKPLIRLIDRTKKIGKLGLEATEQPPGEAITASPGHELMKAFDNALVVEQEGRILADLDRLKVPTGADRERVLVRYLAAFQ